MTNQQKDELDALGAKIKTAQQQLAAEDLNRPVPGDSAGGNHNTADAMRLAMDLVISVVIGMGIGLMLDRWLGTKPWLMLIFLIFGVAAGFRNFYLFAGKLLRPDKDL
jgi:ATP synthase protein I